MTSVLDVPTESPIRSLAVELRRQLETKQDAMADTRLISLAVPEAGGNGLPMPLRLDVDMPDGAESFGITHHAHKQIASHLGIPWNLYDRLMVGGTAKTRGRKTAAQPDLLTHLANGLLSRERSTRMLRILDGQVRAFLSNRYRPRDNWDLLNEAILPALDAFPGQVVFKRCDLTETHLYIKVFLPELYKPITPRVNDVVRGGVLIKNSEVGAGQLLVAPYTDVLRCTNGMVHTEYGHGERHVGKRITNEGGEGEAWDLYSDATLKLDDAAFFAKVRDNVAASLSGVVFDKIVEEMRDLAGLPVPDAPKAVEILAAKHDLHDGERASMLDALIEEGDRSAWGVVNALTRTARDLDNPDRQTELEELAGRLTSNPSWAAPLAA